MTLTATTTNFTLTATFGDGTESPHSAPFAFNSGDSGTTDTGDTGTSDSGTTGSTDGSTRGTDSTTSGSATIGSKLFTFTWEQPSDLTNISGYRFYLNNTQLCATNTASSTSISCKANLLP